MMVKELRYPIAERFKSIQGEGVYTGTPMAFIRTVGCSVGKVTCKHCDTNFDRMYESLGGGSYTVEELKKWVGDYEHVCLTGGEPLDRDLLPIVEALEPGTVVHVETSGTKPIPKWMQGVVWVTVSPKPKYLESEVMLADEIKVILGGLGDGLGWPGIADAISWAKLGKIVYLQPRNFTLTPNHDELAKVFDLVVDHPNLRLSTQFHKFLSVR